MLAWFIVQVHALNAQGRRQLEWEETRRSNDAPARRAALGFPCAVEIKDGGRDERHDTVCEFSGR
ncbi:hypothetical protein [Roseateles saccharophilus]|nr:hypothetical protein [Roseateles saccharophilus]MDG0833450.1 hypothetical protein [Roseateles saccharophilus]